MYMQGGWLVIVSAVASVQVMADAQACMVLG